jgi:hypothetical protein
MANPKISEVERNYRLKYAAFLIIVVVSILTVVWIVFNEENISSSIFGLTAFVLAAVGTVIALRISKKTTYKFSRTSK